MANRRDLQEEVLFVSNLKELVTAYEEIAVMRIDRVRKSVLGARLFREGLSSVVTDVRSAHHRQISALEKKKKETIARPRDVAVLLSTNSRLSGRITPLVSQFFAKNVPDDSEIIIVGQVGKEQFG